jgi:beta-glucosidase
MDRTAIGLLLLITCVACEQQHSAIEPVPRNTFWLKRHEQINARVEQGNFDLVFIGDSITQGWEDEGQEAWDRYYAVRNAVNLGITGDRTQHVIWRLQNGNFQGLKPKVAVILIGTVNAKRNKPQETADGVSRIVSMVLERSPETRILLCGILPRGRDRTNERRLVNIKVNRIISRLADDEHVYYLDIGHRFIDEDGTLLQELMLDDRHLSAAGYSIWAEAMEAMLARLMQEE